MMGFLISQKECNELNYILRKELEELLLDLGDKRIDGSVRSAMEDRYGIVFKMYSRIATPKELSPYIRNKQSH